MPGNDGYTTFLTHFNKDFSDDAVNSDPINKQNHILTTNYKKYGDQGAEFGSSGLYWQNRYDWIEFADHDDWNIGTGEHSLSSWIKFGALVINTDYVICGQCADLSNRVIFSYRYFTSPKALMVYVCSGGSVLVNVTCNWTASSHTEYHVRFVRSGTKLYFFVDGVLLNVGGTDIGTVTFPDIAAPFVIGRQMDETYPSPLRGNIDDFEWAKGIARSITDFTPAQVVKDEYTKLWLEFEGDYITDSSNSVHQLSGGNIGLVNGVGDPDYTTGYGIFNGSSSYCYTTDSDEFTFAGNDFTVRDRICMDVLPTSGNYYILKGQVVYTDINNRWIFFIWNSSGTYKLGFFANNAGVIKIYQTATITISTGNWYHFQYCRGGASGYLFQDGNVLTIDGGGTAPGVNVLPNLAVLLQLGRQNIPGYYYYFNGKMDYTAIDDVCRNTISFTPSELSDSHVKYWLRFNGRIEDSSDSKHPVTGSNVGLGYTTYETACPTRWNDGVLNLKQNDIAYQQSYISYKVGTGNWE